jgi:ribosomal protein S18 acetylase RimI-like enzyme
MDIRPLTPADLPWASGLIVGYFGSTTVISRGVLHDALQLPGLVAFAEGKPVGLVQYRFAGDDCEVVLIAAAQRRRGIGTALLAAARGVAQRAGCRRLWLVTSNDNRSAQAFYEAQRMRLVTIHRGTITQARVLKPEIPWTGENGVLIEDEIEYEIVLEMT